MSRQRATESTFHRQHRGLPMNSVSPLAKKLSPGKYFGQVGSTRCVAGMHLAESRHRHADHSPAHVHSSPFFYLVIEGNCRESSRGSSRILAPGDLVFHPAGELHANDWEGETRCFYLEFLSGWQTTRAEHAPLLSQPRHLREGYAPTLARQLYREFRQNDSASTIAIEGLGLELLAEIARSDLSGRKLPSAAAWLDHVEDLLNANFREPLSLREIAEAVGVHPSHLARVFKARHGCSVGESLRQRRLEFAVRQLRSSAMSLAEIAVAAGFADQSQFSKAFKRQFGCTPGALRKKF